MPLPCTRSMRSEVPWTQLHPQPQYCPLLMCGVRRVVRWWLWPTTSPSRAAPSVPVRTPCSGALPSWLRRRGCPWCTWQLTQVCALAGSTACAAAGPTTGASSHMPMLLTSIRSQSYNCCCNCRGWLQGACAGVKEWLVLFHTPDSLCCTSQRYSSCILLPCLTGKPSVCVACPPLRC